MIPSFSKPPSRTPFSKYTIFTFFLFFSSGYTSWQKRILRPDKHSPLTRNGTWSPPVSCFAGLFSIKCFSTKRARSLALTHHNNIPTLPVPYLCLRKNKGDHTHSFLQPISSYKCFTTINDSIPSWRTFTIDARRLERPLLQRLILGVIILSAIAKST